MLSSYMQKIKQEVYMETFNLKKSVSAFVDSLGFTSWTKIQEKTIPLAIRRKNIIGISDTGTGKTLAYLLPVFNQVNTANPNVQAVITAPTRELAQQIYSVASSYRKFDEEVRIRLVIGGVDKEREVNSLSKTQPHIVIGTPGRIKDLFLGEKVLRVDTANMFVVDEADMTLEFGFLDDIDAVCGRMSDKLQMMVFSATIPQSLRPFIKKYLSNATTIEIKNETKFAPNITYQLIDCKHRDYNEVLLNVLHSIHPYVCLIFANTRKQASITAAMLRNKGEKVVELHGGLDARSRNNALKQLQSTKSMYIVASDIAARGIDIPEISHVISLGIPSELDYFIHRAGRTGRAGASGFCITLYNEEDLKGINTLRSRGIHFIEGQYRNGEFKQMRKRVRPMSKDDQLSIEIAKTLGKRTEKVKPGYKKKRKAMVDKIKRSKKRAFIQGKIMEERKERYKAQQRAKREGN